MRVKGFLSEVKVPLMYGVHCFYAGIGKLQDENSHRQCVAFVELEISKSGHLYPAQESQRNAKTAPSGVRDCPNI